MPMVDSRKTTKTRLDVVGVLYDSMVANGVPLMDSIYLIWDSFRLVAINSSVIIHAYDYVGDELRVTTRYDSF